MAIPSPENLEKYREIAAQLPTFSVECLKIAGKQGRIEPLLWNKAQWYIHERLEAQMRDLGMVRALILKGRQQGVSTYVAARFYHRTSTWKGQKALIVGHEQKSTDALFGMVKRYHEHNRLAPETGSTNAKELVFSRIDGGYKLATAGTQDVGRGNTAQVAHLSEFAFWSNAQAHMAGLGNTIADLRGTEIIIESTANGLGNAFHLMWQAAEAGLNDYAAIFVPWFWQDEYRSAVRDGLELSPEDVIYQQAYGLDREQMQWRANKLSAYGPGFEWLFDQEYPATPALAFQSSTSNPLISPSLVAAAVNSDYQDRFGPLVIACDPAGDGSNDPDRTAIVFRRGRVVTRIEYHSALNTMQIAGKLAEYWQQHQPDAIFIDKTGLGTGVVDRLNELGIPAIGVHSGQAATNPAEFENKKAEMWWAMRDWFMDTPVRLPNNASLISDLTAPQPDVSSNGRKILEKKASLARRGIRSPDGADALALTFYMPVQRAGAETHAFMRQRSYAAASSAGY